jgi:hypothetical protein
MSHIQRGLFVPRIGGTSKIQLKIPLTIFRRTHVKDGSIMLDRETMGAAATSRKRVAPLRQSDDRITVSKRRCGWWQPAVLMSGIFAFLMCINPVYAVTTTNNNFTMLDPDGIAIGGANDVIFTWDGTLYTDPLTQTTPNISLASATPTPFFGIPWSVHDARAFGPGSYSFDTARGNTLNLEVGADQIGAHLLFDWVDTNIDMVLLWNRDTTVAGEIYGIPAGQVFGLASTDGNGDGIPGIPMVDGPFAGFTPTFNLTHPAAVAP